MGGGSKGGSQTIGYKYFMGLHMAICHGPVDSINQVYVGERSLDITPATSNTTKQIFQPDLFGGDKKEGGIVGDAEIEFGGDTQTVNSYLETQFGAGITPAFRGVTCVVFTVSTLPLGVDVPGFGITPNGYISDSGGGYVAAMSPYPKPWAFDVTDIPGGTFNQTKQIVNGTANGGHIIYDCLTNTDWGLGLPELDLNLTSFTAATDTLFDEGFGLSMIYSQQSTMEDFIKEVLTHINAVLYTDRQTGQFVLKLIRDDFTPASLPVFDETNISSLVSFERPAFAEMVNEIVLTYRRQGAFEDTTITAQDLASIQAQQGIISQTSDFPGLDDDTIAALVAQRELKQSSTPLAKIRIIANREAWNVNPGDVIKFSWAAYGIAEVIIRIGAVDYGTLENGLVGIDGVEDVFGLPLNTYLTPETSGWSDQVGPPIPAPSTLAIELPFFVIETTFLIAEINELVDSSAVLQSVAEFPAIATFGYQLRTRTGADPFVEVSNGEFAPTCQLTGNLDRTTKVAIPIKNFKGGLASVIISGYAYLNNEVLRVDSVDLTNNLINLGRGYLDSVPLSHTTDDIIYFADSNNAIDPNIYEETDSVDAKVLTQTSSGLLDPDDAVTDNLVMVARRHKPYPPAQVRINSTYFPATVEIDLITVTWTHQDRTQQLVVGGQDWYEISLGSPEVGVLYEVRYYQVSGDVLLDTDSGISGLTSSFSPSTTPGVAVDIRVEIDAIRDATVTNLNTFEHVFSYTKPFIATGDLQADDSVMVGAANTV